MADGQPEHIAAPPQDLVALADAEEQARWNNLSEEELHQEIAQYRTRLQSLAQDLASASVAPSEQIGGGVCSCTHSHSPKC
jgi:hypothetical protein